MLGFPKTTELTKQLPKKAIYAKFNMKSADKARFDSLISRITIVGELSPSTINISQGDETPVIFVLLVSLKDKDIDEKVLMQLSKLIDQKMIFVLEYSGEQKLAIYHNKLIQNEWENSGEQTLNIEGLTLDKVFENFIIQIGGINIQGENTLDEQITVDEEKDKIRKQISRLEKRMAKERQPRKKFDLYEQIKRLEKEIDKEY